MAVVKLPWYLLQRRTLKMLVVLVLVPVLMLMFVVTPMLRLKLSIWILFSSICHFNTVCDAA